MNEDTLDELHKVVGDILMTVLDEGLEDEVSEEIGNDDTEQSDLQ